MSQVGSPRFAGAKQRLVIALAGVIAGALVGWAAATVFTPPRDVLSSTRFTTVEVVNGEVGSSLTLNTVAEWTPTPVGRNRAFGVVTSVSAASGDRVDSGDVLYAVDLRPVVVAEGTTPSFRDLTVGDRGRDVKQLRTMLRSAGFTSAKPRPIFDSGTRIAVEEWQRSLGLIADGEVRAGDVIYVPRLPARVTLDREVVDESASVSGGEVVLSALPSAPDFSIPVTDAQAAMMPTGTRVEITSPSGELWVGVVADRSTDSENATVMTLTGENSARICADECGSIDVTGQTLLLSRVITVESETGLIVPTAALVTAADGSIAIVDARGRRHLVTVTTSAKGQSIVAGIGAGVDAGLSVRVPAVVD